MAKRKGFMMYFEWVDMLEELSGEEVKRLMLDMNRYVNTGRIPAYDNREMRMAWKMISARLDADGERYSRTVEKNQAAANKRWERERQPEDPISADDWRKNVPAAAKKYL